MKREGTSEGFALDLRVELVAPAEAAGLAGAAGDPLRNRGPVPGPVSSHQIGEQGVLLRRPRPLHSLIRRRSPLRPIECSRDDHVVVVPGARRKRRRVGRLGMGLDCGLRLGRGGGQRW
jgi:hypothetical protein